MNKSIFFILAFICLLKPGACFDFNWKNLTEKFQNITAKVANVVNVQPDFMSCSPLIWKWTKPEVNRPNATFREIIYKIEYLLGKEWYVANYRDRNPVLLIPGAYCPSYWDTRWRGYKSAILHKLSFKYWWKWKGSMMSIQLKSDFLNNVYEDYMLKVSSAMRKAAVCLIKEFSVMKEEEPKKEGFWDKLKSKVGVQLGESYEWYNYT